MPSNNEYVLPLWGENNKETNFDEGRVFYFIPKLGVDVIHFSEIIYSRPGLRREKELLYVTERSGINSIGPFTLSKSSKDKFPSYNFSGLKNSCNKLQRYFVQFVTPQL
jgi:hypothetical protein